MKWQPVVVLVLCAWSVCTGAYFDYYAGAMTASCEVYSEKYEGEILYYDGPYSDVNESTWFADVEQEAYVSDDSFAYSYNAIWDINAPSSGSVALRFNSFADVEETTADCNGYGYGYGSTEDTQTFGMFYMVAPHLGEDYGDAVTVYVSVTIKVGAWGDNYTYIGGCGPYMDHMAITVNQPLPVVDAPEPAYEVWTLDNLELLDSGTDEYTGVYSFDARVGDVVGVFAENYTDITGQGPLSGLVESDLTIVLTARLTGDLDGDGDVDGYDFARFANNWLAGIQ